MDYKSEEIEAWEESRLSQTLGARKAPAINLAHKVGNIHPIFQVNIPAIPQPTLDQMDMAFHHGADAPKSATITAVTSGSKYMDRKLTHLLVFCRLQSTEHQTLPKIWTSLQCTKDWYNTGTKLKNGFACTRTLEMFRISSIRSW